MGNKDQNNCKRGKGFLFSILSLSLLTVMAGAAVAPALNVIKSHFIGVNNLLIQLIVSIPALFIVITNILFPALCKRFKSKTLVFIGLILYTFGGCLAGAIDNIRFVLSARALVGIGVGIIMPMSTGLLAFYFSPDKQAKLMGYSSAMNQMGGVIATMLAGFLANISRSLSFLVYLLGLISIVLCFIFLPNEHITSNDSEEKSGSLKKSFFNNFVYIFAIFLLMTIFFLYPTNFAIQESSRGILNQSLITITMAIMDFSAFFGGLLFVRAKILCGKWTKIIAPSLFFIGYVGLLISSGFIGILLSSIFIGFANGLGIPFIISEASMKAGKAAIATVMPLISAALYSAQFLCPFFMQGLSSIIGGIKLLPYRFGIVLAVCFIARSLRIPNLNFTKH